MRTIGANVVILAVILGVLAKAQGFYIYVPDEMIEHQRGARRAAWSPDGPVTQGQMWNNQVGSSFSELPNGGIQKDLFTQTGWKADGRVLPQNFLQIDLSALAPSLIPK